MDRSSRLHLYQSLLISIVLLFICAMIGTFYYASRHVSRVTDPDYYRHGVEYSNAMSAVRKGALLGWQMKQKLSGNLLEVSLADATGKPLAGGVLQFLPETHGVTPVTLLFKEAGTGQFRAVLPEGTDELKGVLSFSIGDATIINKLVMIN